MRLENCRKKFFHNFFQFFRNCVGGFKILKFKMAFSIKNIEIWNLTRWNQILTTPQLTLLSVRIKNPRWSKKSDNSLCCIIMFRTIIQLLYKYYTTFDNLRDVLQFAFTSLKRLVWKTTTLLYNKIWENLIRP